MRKLLERVDRNLPGTVLRLWVEDRYVRVHTENGQANVLMRFAAAITKLGGAEGLQVR